MLSKKTIAVSLALLLVLVAPASAQDPSQLVGEIPGTDMLRDEFRARALIQLKAIALNALAYRVLHGDEYPANYYELRDSTAWNLDVTNMFTGQPVQPIYFEPGDNDYTSRPVLDLPMAVEQPAPVIDVFSGEDGGLSLEDALPAAAFLSPLVQQRVDPGKIRYYTAGDIFYYVHGDLVQLVLFAPDGSYLEHVDESPNLRWQGILQVPLGAPWPDSITAAQVLLFTGRLLMQHYNLVEFMGGHETIPPARFAGIGAAERTGMARHLGITLLNPHTQQPIVLAPQASTGDFAEPGPAAPLPLRIWLRDGKLWSIDEMHGRSESQPAQDNGTDEGPSKPERKPPPMGGRK